MSRISPSTSNRRRKSNIPRLYVEVANFTLNLLSLLSAIYKANGVTGGSISCPDEIPAQAGERLCGAEYVGEQDIASASGHLVADSIIHMRQMK